MGKNFKKSIVFKALAIWLALLLGVPGHLVLAQTPNNNVMRASQRLAPTQNLLSVSADYSYPSLKGLRFNPNDPLKLEFIIDTANQGKVTKEESTKLIKYFLAGLTLPEDDLWVNLSPYEQDRIVPESLGDTDLGKEMLEQDYLLKQLAAGLTHPETEAGRKYWDAFGDSKLQIANCKFSNGTKNLQSAMCNVQSFQKVWITPDQAAIYENNNTGFITEATLKVMMEADYVAMQNNVGATRWVAHNPDGNNDTRASHRLAPTQNNDSFKTHILPLIFQDVNHGKNFAPLRQIYNSLILAVWFKQKFKESFYKAYIDQRKIKGIDLTDKKIKEKIWQQYVQAFKDGAYNYVKREATWSRGRVPEAASAARGAVRVPGGRIIRRRYFSGGVAMESLKKDVKITSRQSKSGKTLVVAMGALAAATVIIGANVISKQDVAPRAIYGERYSAGNRGTLPNKAFRLRYGLARSEDLLKEVNRLKDDYADRLVVSHDIEHCRRIVEDIFMRIKTATGEHLFLREGIRDYYAGLLYNGKTTVDALTKAMLEGALEVSEMIAQQVWPATTYPEIQAEIKSLLADTLGVPLGQIILPVIFVPQRFLKQNLSLTPYFYKGIIMPSVYSQKDFRYLLVHEGLHLNGRGFAVSSLNEGMTIYLTTKIFMQREGVRDFSRDSVIKYYKKHSHEIICWNCSIVNLTDLEVVLALRDYAGEDALLEAYATGYDGFVRVFFGDKVWENIISITQDYYGFLDERQSREYLAKISNILQTFPAATIGSQAYAPRPRRRSKLGESRERKLRRIKQKKATGSDPLGGVNLTAKNFKIKTNGDGSNVGAALASAPNNRAQASSAPTDNNTQNYDYLTFEITALESVTKTQVQDMLAVGG